MQSIEATTATITFKKSAVRKQHIRKNLQFAKNLLLEHQNCIDMNDCMWKKSEPYIKYINKKISFHVVLKHVS